MSNTALKLDTFEQHKPLASYQPRSPLNSAYHKLVADNYEELEDTWESDYQHMYGYWRPHVLDVIYKYLDCGDPHLGFARVKCTHCNTEYLLPFSCKCRSFCPSCHQRRVVEFGEFLREEVLEDVPHRQWVFTIPKRLRPYFMHNRKLLAKLSRCAWEVLSDYLMTSVTTDTDDNVKPGLVAGKACYSPMQPGCTIAVQTFGELANFNPHVHVIASSGCFKNNGDFLYGISPNAEDLTAPFANAVFKMLKKENVISLAVINNMSTWQHSGFNIHCGSSVNFSDADAVERLARYIVRAPISQERLKYIPDKNSRNGIWKVIYEGKTTKRVETFSALDLLARLVTHIPNKYEQTVRYYGYYSNKSRGVRAKAKANAIDEAASNSGNPATYAPVAVPLQAFEFHRENLLDATTVPSAPNTVSVSLSRKRFKKNWARLIQKIYNIDPLKCPKCNGKMRIVAFIEEEAVIKKILSHLNLWLPQYHDPPDSPDYCYDSSVPTSAAFSPLLEAKDCEDLQLNMFSGRSYEWWEAGNRVNACTRANNRQSDLKYKNSHEECQYSYEDHQHPYEDEFSQEVFYED